MQRVLGRQVRFFGAFVEDAVFQVQDAIDEGDDAGIMGDHENGGAVVVGGGAEKLNDVLAMLPVEGGGRFIGEDESRLLDGTRPIATRCFSPPDIWSGRRSAFFARPSMASISSVFSWASRADAPVPQTRTISICWRAVSEANRL